ncbi:MAG TPA: thioesterase domain-containing protein, partial [Candidatus Angelobacter sp.]|nr:thioesterase domain-containing protein [Candidatus Angelobacter sp.]
ARRRYEAPQGEVEQSLAGIWQELLKLERVGRHDHFFELGGHSLLAVQLLVRVRQTFGASITLRDLFTYPTLSGLSTVLNSGNSKTTHQNLIPIRPEGTELPLFLIHSGGGGIDYARSMAPFVNIDMPIYGLEASGLTPGQEPLKTIEEMAELYIYWIRQVQQHGPYRIAGWSAGGIICYEIARRLIDLGECVEFLGLLDTFYHQSSAAAESFDDKSELIQFLSRRVDQQALDHIKQVAEAFDFQRLVEHIYETKLLPEELESLPILDGLTIHCALATRYATRRAVDNYSLVKLPVPVWLFEAKENDPPTSHGWRDLLGDDMHVIAVDGKHTTMMTGEERLRYLGAAICEGIALSSLQAAA